VAGVTDCPPYSESMESIDRSCCCLERSTRKSVKRRLTLLDACWHSADRITTSSSEKLSTGPGGGEVGMITLPLEEVTPDEEEEAPGASLLMASSTACVAPVDALLIGKHKVEWLVMPNASSKTLSNAACDVESAGRHSGSPERATNEGKLWDRLTTKRFRRGR